MSSNVVLNYSASSIVDGVTNVFSISASGVYTLDIDLTDVPEKCTGLITVTYPQTSATTGLTCRVYQGYGPGLPVNMYQPIPCQLFSSAPPNPRSTGQVFSTIGLETSTDGDQVTMAPPTPSNGSAETKYTPFALTLPLTSKFVSFKFTNTDPVYTPTVIVRLNV